MNKERRKKTAEACDFIYKALYILEEVYEEEQNAYDNLPDNLTYSSTGEKLEKNVDVLEEIKDTLLDFTTNLEEIME